MASPKMPIEDQAGDGDSERAMRIDTALVRELAELLTENGLTDIEVEDGDRKIRVSRTAPPVAMAPAAAAATAYSAVPSSSPGEGSRGTAPAAESETVGEPVKSPMVGTAFLSAEPGSAPFVAVGDTVKAGDTLLIVEAMKVMNPITAPSAGIVRRILVSDAQPVEFDQPLLVIG